MEIDNLRWWHWMVISLAVGALLGWANSGIPEPVRFRSLDSLKFQQYVMKPPVAKIYPMVTDIVIYPIARTGDSPTTKGMTFQLVTCKYVEQSQKASAGLEYVPAYVTTTVPFDLKIYDKSMGCTVYVAQPGDTLHGVTAAKFGKDTVEGREAIVDANPRLSNAQSAEQRNEFRAGFSYVIPWNPAEMKTVRDFLNAAAKEHDWVRPHYAWWKETRYCYVTWMGGCFLVFGVVMPALIYGIGGGGRKEKKAGGYDLDRFGHGKEPAKQPAKTGITQNDMDQLAEIEAALQASLKAAGSPRMTAPAAETPAPATPVRVLTGTKAEPIKPTTPAAPESAKFDGSERYEYYPVAKGKKRKE